MLVVLNLLTEEILKEAKIRMPGTHISTIVMTEVVEDLWAEIRASLKNKVVEGVQKLFSTKQVVLTDNGIEFREREDARKES